MKLFLFGGAEESLGQVEIELKLIEELINELKPKQLLHVPFARTVSSVKEWQGDWFHRYINLDGIEYLNAENEADIIKAQSPIIFISGGTKRVNLMRKISANSLLKEMILKADYIVGESAGSMAMGEYMRSDEADNPSRLIKGLGIVKNTVFEVHYTEKKRQALLMREMNESGASYGVGIDCATAIEFEVDEFPDKYEKIGPGSIEIKQAN